MVFSSLTAGQALAGIGWAIAAFSFKNIGYVLQKSGVNKSGLDRTITTENSQIEKKTQSGENSENAAGKLLKSATWWIGQSITLFGAFSLIIAYGTAAPLPLIMPFMGVGLIISVIFCRFYLKENVSKKEWLSSFTIIVGVVLVTLVYKNLPAEPGSLSFYFNAYTHPASILFFILAIGGLATACIWSIKNKYKFASLIFGIAAGDIGGTSLLFQSPMSKGIDILINGSALETGFWWMFILGFLGFAVGGVLAIVFENIGYMHGQGILVAPLYATFQMLFPIIGGIIVFQQWSGASLLTIVLQSVGIVIITLGTFFLSYTNTKKKKETLKD